MKKLVGFVMAAAMMSIIACGPSEAERKAEDERIKKQSEKDADSLIKSMHDADAKSATADTSKKAPADTTKSK
jgi:hypothetical protein